MHGLEVQIVRKRWFCLPDHGTGMAWTKRTCLGAFGLGWLRRCIYRRKTHFLEAFHILYISHFTFFITEGFSHSSQHDLMAKLECYGRGKHWEFEVILSCHVALRCKWDIFVNWTCPEPKYDGNQP